MIWLNRPSVLLGRNLGITCPAARGPTCAAGWRWRSSHWWNGSTKSWVRSTQILPNYSTESPYVSLPREKRNPSWGVQSSEKGVGSQGLREEVITWTRCFFLSETKKALHSAGSFLFSSSPELLYIVYQLVNVYHLIDDQIFGIFNSFNSL